MMNSMQRTRVGLLFALVGITNGMIPVGLQPVLLVE
jgi:hypothetical protein